MSEARALRSQGPAVTFHNHSRFLDVVGGLRSEGLEVLSFDAQAWLHIDDFVLAAWSALALPRTRSSFVNFAAYLRTEGAEGLVWAFENFDDFRAADVDAADAVVELLTNRVSELAPHGVVWLVLLHARQG